MDCDRVQGIKILLKKGQTQMREFIFQYWIEALFGLAITGLSFGYNRLKKRFKEQDALKEGLVAILHDRLFQSGMYFLGKGEISVHELDNIEGIYNAYHKLGGNGTGTEIYERVRELQLKK